MKTSFRRVLAVAAAAVTIAAASVTTAQAAGPDVYTTPGGHIQNGRLWQTTCAQYSTTVVRCTTNIWATQITYDGANYVAKTGWHFNNLTYLPSLRSAWKNNPLGGNGQVGKASTWTSAGRQWRTECDTLATGRGACRSYIQTDVITSTPTSSGVTYRRVSQWVFNNIVRFAEGSVRPVTKVPADVLAQSRLTFSGLGTLQVGTSMDDLAKLGYAADAWANIDPCRHDISMSSINLSKRGVEIYSADGTNKLALVTVTTPAFATDKGGKVGMTVTQMKAIYGAAFQPVTDGGESYYARIDGGATSLVFGIDPATSKIVDISVYDDSVSFQCR